nr:hypothetical protein [Tanacetum cinerariifolium]
VPPKVVETIDLSNPVTSNSVPTTKESKFVKNDKVIFPRMFRINPSMTSKEDKFVPINQSRVSVRTNLITVSQPHIVTKKDVNSDSNSLSSTGVDITTKTRRPQPMSNIKNDKDPSASKISFIKNKEVEVEDHLTNLLFSINKKHMLSECYNIKLAIQNDKSEVHFLILKDEAPEEIKTFLKKITVLLQALVIINTSTKWIRRTQNSYISKVVRIMLIFSCALLFLWAEATATSCYTKNCSIIHHQFDKTPYELINGRKPDISYLHVFGALCFPKNDHEDIGKLGTKAAPRTNLAAPVPQVLHTSMASTIIADTTLTPTNLP